MSKILVTGAAGFIGSHTCEKFLKCGYNVIGLDSFNDFYNPEIKRRNAKEINLTAEKEGWNFSMQEGDIRDRKSLDNLFADNEIEAIVHLAAYAGVRPSILNPVLYTDVNINGTVNLLECCRENGINKFIFASSSSVYGNNEKVLFSESDSVDFPISPYAATKKAGELLCHSYHHLYDVNIACLRFFTVYGPRQRPDLAIHMFTNKILNDEPIPFYGDGNTERDYTYIDDIMDGVFKAYKWLKVEHNVTDGCLTPKRSKYEIFNLGEANTISLSRMVQTLEAAIWKKAILNRLPMQPGDVNRTSADISKAKAVLGYDPRTKFEDGITKFVEWYRAIRSISL